jgi:hypothetical protein
MQRRRILEGHRRAVRILTAARHHATKMSHLIEKSFRSENRNSTGFSIITASRISWQYCVEASKRMSQWRDECTLTFMALFMCDRNYSDKWRAIDASIS